MFLCRVFAALLAVCVLSGAVHAATGEPPALSAAAQSAMDRGLAAVKQKKWDLAIKHFSEAQKEAPANPEALFNLALAYDSAKGRELLALCWFYAYLEVAPDAPNAEQVRKKIPELDAAVEGNLHKLAQMAADTTAKLPERFDTSGPEFRHHTFTATTPKSLLKGLLPVTWARAGKVESAYQSAEDFALESYPTSPDYQIKEKDAKYHNIAQVQARAGDMEGARKTAAKITAGSSWGLDEKALAVQAGIGKCDAIYDWPYIAGRIQRNAGAGLPGMHGGAAAVDMQGFLNHLKGKSAAASLIQMHDAVETLSKEFAFVRNCAALKGRKEDKSVMQSGKTP